MLRVPVALPSNAFFGATRKLVDRVEDTATVAVLFRVYFGETDIVWACCLKIVEISLAEEVAKNKRDECP